MIYLSHRLCCCCCCCVVWKWREVVVMHIFSRKERCHMNCLEVTLISTLHLLNGLITAVSFYVFSGVWRLERALKEEESQKWNSTARSRTWQNILCSCCFTSRAFVSRHKTHKSEMVAVTIYLSLVVASLIYAYFKLFYRKL